MALTNARTLTTIRSVTFSEDRTHTRHFIAEAAFPRSDDHPILSHCCIFRRRLHFVEWCCQVLDLLGRHRSPSLPSSQCTSKHMGLLLVLSLNPTCHPFSYSYVIDNNRSGSFLSYVVVEIVWLCELSSASYSSLKVPH